MRPDFIHPVSTTEAFSPASEVASKPGPERRRRLDQAGAREAILAAAETLLVETGPAGLRLTEIAARAGVSHPNVLYHFGSASALQAQLAQRVATRLAGEIARAYELEADHEMPIDRTVLAVFRVFEDGGYARLFAWLALSANEPTFEALGAELERVRSAIASHPALAGDENAGRRRRVVPAIDLVISAAIGHALSRTMIGALFAPDSDRPAVARFLSELLTTTIPGQPRPAPSPPAGPAT